LPARAGQVRADRFAQTGVASLLMSRTLLGPRTTRSAKNSFLADPGFARGHAQAEHFAVAVIVDAGRERDDGVDHAASFTRVHREGVGGDERERACIVEGAVAKSSWSWSRSAAIRLT